MWFDHVEAAAKVAELEPRYVFVVDPTDPSVDVITERAPECTLVEVEDRRALDARVWSTGRYRRMVELRNLLLGAVRHAGPDLFLSLDSDVLLHDQALALMVEDLERFDAVGTKCYMTPTGTSAPSYGNLGRVGTLQRVDSGGVFSCQVIMAAKLMSPRAYAVDYQFDLQGEDIGWSKACALAGVRLGWDGRVGSKHVMSPGMLVEVDLRVGF